MCALGGFPLGRLAGHALGDRALVLRQGLCRARGFCALLRSPRLPLRDPLAILQLLPLPLQGRVR
jgi:hypothetical protein